MALTARQTKLYIHSCLAYKLKEPIPGASGFGPNEPINQEIDSFGGGSSFSWYYESGPELTRRKFYGARNQEDTVSLMDRGHFEDNANISIGDYIKMTTVGHPLENSWFVVTGEAMVKNYRANKQVFYIKKVTKPKGIA